MNRAYYDIKPKAYEAVGNGSYIYRWDIQEETISSENRTDSEEGEEPETRTQFSCNEVVVWGTVSSNKLTQSVVAALWGDGVEEKMLNDYNAAVLGILEGKYIEKYKNFLQERKAIKEQVDADCVEFGIV